MMCIKISPRGLFAVKITYKFPSFIIKRNVCVCRGERGEVGHYFKLADFFLISFYRRDDYISFWACMKVHMVGYIKSHKLGVAQFSIFCS